MLSFCLKCRKNTESKNPKVARTKNWRMMILSKFIKQQQTSGLLSSLWAKRPSNEIPLLGLGPLF